MIGDSVPRIIHRAAVLLLSIISLIGSVAAQDGTVVSESPRYSELIVQGRNLVRSFMREQSPPGISIAVAVEGETVWAEGFGFADMEGLQPVTPLSQFRIGSISKPITAAAAALLHAAGNLDVDAPVQQYVPSFPRKRYPITTRLLGGHLAGIRHYRGDEFLSTEHYDSVLDAIEIFADDSLLFAPGERYSYSSYAWNLISAIIEGASGESFLDHMQATVFDPLGMDHTRADQVDSFFVNRVSFYQRNSGGNLEIAPEVDLSVKWAGGGFLSTTHDLIRFANAHLGDTFIPPAGKALLFAEAHTSLGEGVGYGFGWRLQHDGNGRLLLGHSGGSVGGSSVMILQPDLDLVVIALVNQSSADLRIGRDLMALFANGLEAEE